MKGKIKVMILFVSMFIFANALADTANRFGLVTDASTLAEGDEVLIAYVTDNRCRVLSRTQLNNYRLATNDVVRNADGTITPGAEAQLLTIVTADSCYLFHVEGTYQQEGTGGYFSTQSGGYLCAPSSYFSFLRTCSDSYPYKEAKATIDITNGEATITFQAWKHNTMRYDSVANHNYRMYFSCYLPTATNGFLPQIYRKIPSVTLNHTNMNNGILIASNAGKLVDATLYGCTLRKNDTWNTLCLPFAVNDFTGTPLEGAIVKTLSGSVYNNSTGTLTLIFSDTLSAIEAGKPYFVKWSEGEDIQHPVFPGVVMSAETNNIETPYVDFIGCFAPVALAANDSTKYYFDTNGQPVLPEENTNVYAFSAYFAINDTIAFLPDLNIVLDYENENSGTCGRDLTWILQNGMLTISGTGAMENYTSSSRAPWYSSRDSITSVIINNGVTSIGDRAFNGLRDLVSVVIPNSVRTIGENAFSACNSLPSITLPNSVISIGDYAFSSCDSLANISLSDSLINIGAGAFYHCLSLPVDNNLRYADYYLVETIDTTLTSYTIKNGTTWIGEWAFYKCSRMTSVSIPNTVKRIDQYAFRECSSLSSVSIPNSVTNLEKGSFMRCTGLTTVSLGDSITYIGESAFQQCSGLTSIDIPNSVKSIRTYAFYSCPNLITVSISSSVDSISYRAFGYCDSLAQVYVYNPTPITITDVEYGYENIIFYTFTSFGNIIPQNLHIYVPFGSENAYKTTQYWSDYASRIEPFPLSYEIIYDVNDSIRGLVDAFIPQSECDSAVLTATPNYGYYFSKWSDNTTSNPYVLYATQDTTITAIFEKNSYTIQTLVNDASFGTTVGDTTAYYLDTVKITAIPNENYHFSSWSDDNKDNPRNVIVTDNCIFEAIFALDDTAIGNINSSSSLPKKVLENGQLVILLPDGTRYTATGQLVK